MIKRKIKLTWATEFRKLLKKYGLDNESVITEFQLYIRWMERNITERTKLKDQLDAEHAPVEEYIRRMKELNKRMGEKK